MIAEGEKLPEATLKLVTEDGSRDVTTAEFFGGRKVVLFGVPGAFTPTCSNNHLPGFIDNYDAILARGVDQIAVVSVNDQWVMKAWARFSGGEGRIAFLADGNGTFVRAVGLDANMEAAGFGTRSKRFSMIVDDGIVTKINIEQARGQVIDSGAARILEQL